MTPKSLDNVVAVARAKPSYEVLDGRAFAPEIGGAATTAEGAMHNLFHIWRLDPDHYGTADWNPLRDLIPQGSRVVVKPNWVFHENQSGAGLDCLLTHHSMIAAAAKYVGLTKPAKLLIGDAPIQGCDFSKLRQLAGINDLENHLRGLGLQLSVQDFRRTILQGKSLGNERFEDARALEHFVLFDLKKDSLLEPANTDADKFRVTMYNPDLLHRTHSPGRHQYLVAKEVIEADVVVNLPKLKTHRKACVTGALKNLIGINGNKEYLPHHRKGGAESGGDCYAGRSMWKHTAENLLDAANRHSPGGTQSALAWTAGAAARVATKLGEDGNLEGAWYGNDTIWRTCLDLQRILRYGRLDGTLSSAPQRTVISLTDAIIGGEGEGPLANTPVASGFITGSLNTAAAEWVHARLMGFAPEKIPLIREAFASFKYPLADFLPESIHAWSSGAEQNVRDIFPFEGRAFVAPRGWQRHCEQTDEDRQARDESMKSQLSA